MIVSDIINNSNFNAEFPYVVRVTNSYGEIIKEFYSYSDKIPEEVKQAEVVWLNVVNGYGDMYNMAVMIIDVFEN